jgi:acetyl/propionyl-CoA carboxylase alpha subunit
MYKVINNETVYEIELSGKNTIVNKINKNIQIVKNPQEYIIQIDGKLHTAQLVKVDIENKQITWRINHVKYTSTIKEPIDILLEKLGMNIAVSKKVNNLKAPMPGLIAKIVVQEGQEVKKGEPLLILEAMKMENVFKAADDVIIKSIKIKEREAVEKNQLLIEFA